VLERLLPLWTQPVDARPDPVAAFGGTYADPVLVNGSELALTELVDRARALQRAFDGLSPWPDLTCAVIASPAWTADRG
jgi:hypothetical protein